MRKLSGNAMLLFAAIVSTSHFASGQVAGGARPPRGVIEVPVQPFIDAYGAKIASELEVDRLTFSPDGRLLALTISGIASGDPEQVWLFDLTSRKLRLATERLYRDSIGLTIHDVRWTSATEALIEESRITWKNQSDNRMEHVRATMDTSMVSPIPWPPPKRRGLWASIPSPSSGLRIELITYPAESRIVNVRTSALRFRDRKRMWAEAAWANDDRHFVFAVQGNKSNHALHAGVIPARADAPVRTIHLVDGGWELTRFAVDPKGPRVAALTAGGIEVFDLNTGQKLQTVATDGRSGLPLGWSSANQFAFVAANRCRAPGSPVEPADPTSRERAMPRVCIIDAPNFR